MGEQRFKVGDWVRVNDNSGAPLDYKVGELCQVNAVGDGLVFAGKKSGMFAARFEPWQPRIGERVRCNGKSTTYSEKELVGLEGEVTGLKGKLVNVKWDKTIVDGIRTGGAKYIENLEPVLADATPKPATLKIEAGKFYKTRDGRKVGPMVVDGPAWTPNGGQHWYRDDGSRYYACDRGGDTDLIAEWVDEPAAKAEASTTASNDNAKPKFKVGDRVKSVEDGPTDGNVGVIIEDDKSAVPFRVAFDNWTGGHGRGDNEWWLCERDILDEPITPPKSTTTIVALIEDGQPKPSSTPHVHASTGAAEAEAKRLAAKYKGKQFGVFTLTTTHEEAAPVYDHKWQNLAVLGLKSDAIASLKAHAGITTDQARRIVYAFAA